MTEKQTPHNTPELQAPRPQQHEEAESELVPQAELDMFNEWSASDAAQRIVGQPAPELPVEERAQPQHSNVYTIPRREIDVAERPDFNVVSARDGQVEDSRPVARKVLAGVVVGAAVAAGAVAMGESLDGGSNQPERGELDTSISSILLKEGANIRFDPYIDRDQPNTVSPITEETLVVTDEGVRILEDEANGTWYGIDVDDILQVNGNSDKDGIVWVNHQGVEEVTR